MPSRKRDYKAEYRRRQERSKSNFGVSYNVQRKLIKENRGVGITATQTREALKRSAATRDDGDIAQTIRELRKTRAKAHQMWLDGKDVPPDLWDSWLNDYGYDFDDEWFYYH